MTKKFVLLVALLFPMLGQSAPISELASLRAVIPLDAVAYLRIPNPWGFLSSPKDNMLKGALEHEAHVQQIENLKSSVYQNILKKAGNLVPPAMTLFLHHLRSPIESVFLLPKQAPPALGNVLISAKLNITSIDEFNDFLKAMVAQAPNLKIFRELENGYGILTAGPIPVFIHYDINSQTLNLMGGLAANQDIFQQTLSTLVPIDQHPMYEMENRIDTSHQGFFEWINLQKILPLFQLAIPPKVALNLQKIGLLNLRAMALGWGVRDGKGRLSLIIDAPRTGYREFFPPISNNLSLTTAGNPGIIASFSLPLLEWLKGFEKIAETEMPPYQFQGYQNAKEIFKKVLGFSIEEALGAFGPEMLFFTDEVGEFAAIRKGDNLEKIIAILVNKFGLVYETREINEKLYHHLVIPPSLGEETQQPESDTQAFFFLELASKLNTHLYWVEEDGYLIFAQIPQQLFDREQKVEHVQIQQWLKEKQGQDIQSSLFFISTSISDTPRQLYYAYLQSLVMLAELADAKLDIFTLPSALALNLPKTGTYGMQLDLSETLLSLEFTFENNPLEFLVSPDNMATVAIIGIVAAVAIPAYNDYLQKAKESE
ncbi:hypothetical protein PN36_27090 [Candidatus Thiomargarita nelsonii]|uniref:DUF3352 domain-containing protein n=1 Tax=Candidatus Thiomargarita nelsonii TaxID=1003181 RepID=A0A0A6P3G8_9GAMM|nr:hypothetical protein PN36_27090 [Candidatus Thiomargarita nelsonii]